MGIGASIAMIAIGAIIKYALPGSVLGIHLGVIGVILMIVGVLGLAVTVLVFMPRSRRPVEPAYVTREPMVDEDPRYVERAPVERGPVEPVVERPVRRRPW
ncbi:MAG TPA: DUF6458 family protein [Pseudonocardia sp.]|jgi:hypothetical protein|nr:DUF6458 family protein [Pseudonocardia sp.]